MDNILDLANQINQIYDQVDTNIGGPQIIEAQEGGGGATTAEAPIRTRSMSHNGSLF